MAYAENTDVSSDKSRQEIERTLTRYGADQFIYAWDQSQAVVGFRMKGLHIRYKLKMPDKNDVQFQRTAVKQLRRQPEQIAKAWEQACRQKWRALALVVKAKLEAVQAGITTFEEEFLSATLLPDGSTVGQWARPQIAAAYKDGKMPALMLSMGER